MSKKRQLIALSCVLAAGFASAGQAAAPQSEAARGSGKASLDLIQHPAERFERNLELGALRIRYANLLENARDLGVAPEQNLLNARRARKPELSRGIDTLKERIAVTGAPTEGVTSGSVAGVSTSTLEAIAACESGGDPTAVNAAGYYGKYQFDTGTWASVGGTGNPAEASESEQDYRAALLYSQAGSSPWPVCGS